MDFFNEQFIRWIIFQRNIFSNIFSFMKSLSYHFSSVLSVKGLYVMNALFFRKVPLRGDPRRPRSPMAGYIPLNSLTLSRHNDKTSTTLEPGDGKPWWERLPNEKINKTKNILSRLDKLRTSDPSWPWMKPNLIGDQLEANKSGLMKLMGSQHQVGIVEIKKFNGSWALASKAKKEMKSGRTNNIHLKDLLWTLFY